MRARGSMWVIPFLLASGLLFPAVALAGPAERHLLDPLNAIYTGVDVNDDEIDDVIYFNIVTGEKKILIGRANGQSDRLQIENLGPEERARFPDLITEVDLDGDQIADLVIANLAKLKKVSGDDTVFMRVLEYSVYFGNKDGRYRHLRFINFSAEHRELIYDNARRTLLGP